MKYEEARAAMERFGKPRTVDLIERGYLLFRINDDPLGYNMDDFDKLYGIILNAPTIDAAIVRYGHWIENDNGTYSCSECHSWIPNEQHYYARYCLYCGAKMNGERREDGRQTD